MRIKIGKLGLGGFGLGFRYYNHKFIPKSLNIYLLCWFIQFNQVKRNEY